MTKGPLRMTDRAIPTTANLLVAASLVAALVACTKSATSSAPTATVTVTETATVTAAAGSSSTPVSPPASLVAAPEPCELLTQAEAEALTQIKLQPGISSGAAGINTLCQYTSDPSGPTAQVEIIVGDGAKKALDIDRDTLGHAFTAVSGIGDEAAQEDGNIFVRKGNIWVDINLVLLNDPAQNVEPMQTAAKAVVARLP